MRYLYIKTNPYGLDIENLPADGSGPSMKEGVTKAGR